MIAIDMKSVPAAVFGFWLGGGNSRDNRPDLGINKILIPTRDLRELFKKFVLVSKEKAERKKRSDAKNNPREMLQVYVYNCTLVNT
jgi:hypothetical protein